MTYTSISERFTKLAARAIKSSRFIALAIIAAVTLGAMQPAQAQSSDTWKSIAIIGGSTAAGAYIGHKVGGSTGTWVGAAAGVHQVRVLARGRLAGTAITVTATVRRTMGITAATTAMAVMADTTGMADTTAHTTMADIRILQASRVTTDTAAGTTAVANHQNEITGQRVRCPDFL